MKKTIFTFLGSICLIAASQAQEVRYVTNNLDDNSAGSLRQTIVNAGEGDSIVVNDDIKNIIINNEIAIEKKLIINANGATISVAVPSESPYRIFRIGDRDLQERYDFKLYNVTLIGGDVTNNNSEAISDIDNCGGCIVTNKTLPDLEASTIHFENVKFLNAKASYSGALQIETNSVATIYNCLFENNHAVNRNAGAFYAKGKLTIDNTKFINNSANYDGGALAINNTEAFISNCLFENNKATIDAAANNGGAFFNTGGAKTVVRNSLFVNNESKNKGGGGFATSGTSTTAFIYCTFTGNKMNSRTKGGGGLANISGYLTVINSTITGNSAGAKGAGIYSENVKSEVKIYNSIVNYNYVNSEKDDVFISTGKLNGMNNIFGTLALGQTVADGDINVIGNIPFSYNPESVLFKSIDSSNGNSVPVLADNGGNLQSIALADGGSIAQSAGKKMGQYTSVTQNDEGVDVSSTRFVFRTSGGSWLDITDDSEVYDEVEVYNTDIRGYEMNEANNPCIGAFEISATSSITPETVTDKTNVIWFDSNTSTLVFSPELTISKVEIYSLSGRQILVDNKTNNGLNLSRLVQGVYIVKVISTDSIYTQKIAVK